VSSGKKSFYYSARPDEIQKRLNSGYSLDGVVGHIYQTVTVNRAPFLERGRILGRRCPEATFDCGGELFRNYYFNQGINLRSLFKHGSRLDSHELLFTLTTWNGFSPENGHLVFMLRNQAEYDPTDVLKSRFDGVGIIIGAFNCPGNNNGNRVTVELWRPDTGTNGQNVVDCSFLSPELSPGVKYDFRVHSYNTGVLSYSIRDHKTQVLVFEKSKNIKDLYENMGGLYRPFPQPFLSAMNVPRNMNYSIFHGTDSKFDFTTYLENITSIWRTGNP
jgi:hypothetical protein